MEQTHMGVWLTTRQSAFSPQEPGHGSLHFWFIQAWWAKHSLLLTHSGRQFGGELINPGKQVQDGESFITWHRALGPHGDGLHTFIISGLVSTKIL